MAGLSTSQLRKAWAPACARYSGQFLAAYTALDACFEAHRYAPRKADTGAYNCRKITGGTGYSLHSYGPGDRFTFWNGTTIATALAVDVNWTTNPYGRRLVTDMPRPMVDAILRVRTRNGKQVWRWGGDYTGSKDGMHFEIVCTPADLATGVDLATVPGAAPVPEAPPSRSRTLRPGMTGPDVAWHQTLLNQVNARWPLGNRRPLKVDASYGAGTTARTREFETWANGMARLAGNPTRLEQDGIATIPTQDALTYWARASRT